MHPFEFTLEGELKNIFYYQCKVESLQIWFSIFLSINKHEYTHGIFWSVILVSEFTLKVYLTFFVPQYLIDRINPYVQKIAFQRNLLLVEF